MRSIVSLTARSLPGIGVAEKITVSPSWSSTCGWSPWAMRRSADSGSPWLPVEMITSLWSGKSSISWGPRACPRARRCGRACARCSRSCASSGPTSETLRPSAAAASTTCWTRWMFDAKQVTTIRPSQRAKTSSRRGPDARLRQRHAGPVGVGRVAAQQQQALAAELGEPGDVGGHAVHRGLVELVVAGDEHRARARR